MKENKLIFPVIGSHMVYRGVISMNQFFTAEVASKTDDFFAPATKIRRIYRTIRQMAIGQAGWAVIMMATSFHDMSGSANACRRLYQLVNPGNDEEELERGEKPVGFYLFSLPGADLQDIKGAVEAANISFAYPSRPTHFVTKSLSFVVAPG